MPSRDRASESAGSRSQALLLLETHDRLRSTLRRVSAAAGALAAATGGLVLFGWALDVRALKSLAPRLATMKPPTALSLLLCGAALCCVHAPRSRPRARRLGHAGAITALLVGALTLVEYSTGLDLGIDVILFPAAVRAESVSLPGRMAPATALAFALAGTSLLLLMLERRRSLLASQSLALTLAAVALVALVGYAFDIPSLYAVEPYSSMALHTAAAFFVLAGGILLVRPDGALVAAVTSDRLGGAMARRLLLPAVVIPPALSWLRWRGQNAGMFGAEFGFALVVVLSMLAIGALIWANARLLDQAHERILHATRLYAVLSGINQAILRISTRDRLFAEVCRIASEIGRFQSSFIAIADAESGSPRVVAHSGDAAAGGAEGLAALAMREGRAVACNDFQRDPAPAAWREAAERAGCRSAAAFPLTVEGRATGAFVLYAAGPDVFVAEEIQLLGEISSDICYALEGMEHEAGRRHAERALRGSEALQGTILDAALDAVLTMDHEGSITEFSLAAEQLFGHTRAQAVGRELASLIIPEPMRDRHRQGLRRYLAAGEGPVLNRRVEMTALRADGSEFPVELTVARIPGEGAPRFVGFVRDITERKELEQQLLQAQKMEAVGRLAGGVAHDFNNLLSVIGGYSEMVFNALLPHDPLRDNLQEVRRAAERAAGLTRQLLAFGRRQVVEPKVIDLNALVSNMEKMLRRLIGEDVELRTSLDPALGPVRADPGQIEQVIMNLAVNARDAMPRGGRLSIGTRNVEVDQAQPRTRVPVEAGPCVMLSVSDTGVGIDAETLPRIFEPFFTTKETGKGTGLGLAMVYGIVKQNGGDLRVHSTPGRGTTFDIYLPRVAEAVEAARPAAAAALARRGGETILLVEDEAMVRTLVRSILEAQGYPVLEAASPEEGLRITQEREGRIDLVLTDVVMPRMSGRELAEKLQARQPDLRILYMSGYTDDAILRHGILQPGTAFLQKPFTPNAVAAKVREVLDGPSTKRS